MTKDLFYKIEGSGIPVLLIHGFTGSHKSFKKVSSFLSSRFKVITVDMIGHGQSMNYEGKNYTFYAALRCAMYNNIRSEIVSFAGNGIVKDSKVNYEIDELNSKFKAINESIIEN